MGKGLVERVGPFSKNLVLFPEDVKNEKDAVKFAKQTIEYAEYLQGKRSTSPYFRRTHTE